MSLRDSLTELGEQDLLLQEQIIAVEEEVRRILRHLNLNPQFIPPEEPN